MHQIPSMEEKSATSSAKPVSLIFMCHHEKIWLSSCPSDFSPIFYRRYVDDCFLLFKDPYHADLFLNFLNLKHRNIKFTIEKEADGKLPFLDVLVCKEGGRLHTSVTENLHFPAWAQVSLVTFL